MSSQRCREEQDRVHGQGTIECEKGASCFNQVLILFQQYHFAKTYKHKFVEQFSVRTKEIETV